MSKNKITIDLPELPKESGMEWSCYKILSPQLPISDSYIVNDRGVFTYVGKREVRICEAFTIVSIVRDRRNNAEYTEIGFIDYSQGKPNIVYKLLETTELYEKSGMNELKGAGFNIEDDAKFRTFLADVKANLNQLILLNIESPVKRSYGSTQYGFEIVNGEVNYDNFIGIDSPIIPSKEYEKYDKVFFCEPKGTLEGQKEYLEEFLKDSPCKTWVKQAVASGLTGITRMFLTNREDMPCAVYNFSAHTSFGKTYIQKIIIGMFGDNRSSAPMSHSADTSASASRRIRNRLNLIYIEDDWTDFFKRKDGAEVLQDKIYENSNGCNVGKANSDGTLRKDTNTWGCTMVSFSEDNNMILSLQNGANGRVASFDSNVSVKSDLMVYGSVEKKSKINRMQSQNYGWIAREYIKALKGLQEEITESFTDLTGKYKKKLNCTDKVASLYAMLDLTYNLAYNFDLFPKSWGPLTFEEMTSQYDSERIVDTEETLYLYLADRIKSQRNVYIPLEEKLNENDYIERINENRQVRGRYTIKDMDDGRRLKIAIVPKSIVDKNILDIEKTFGIINKNISPKAWIKAGWLIPNSNGYATHTCTNITQLYTTGKDKPEVCYKIILEDLTPTKEEREAETKRLQEELEKKKAEDKSKLIQFEKKYLDAPEGMMNLP